MRSSATPTNSAFPSEVRPLTAAERDELLACVSHYGTIFLAVSGGCDSTALLHLVHAWRAAALNPPDVRVLVVNHGLRAEARTEAEAVVESARLLGISAHILTYVGAPLKTGVQAAARALRYNLLFQHISDRGDIRPPVALLTAHHRDDLAETVLMRLARGAGVDGLAAIQTVTGRGDISLVRPLLDVPKARLIATLQALGVSWLEDPSNQNQTYERVRLRLTVNARKKMRLSDAALALTARRMARARDALEQIADAALRPALTQELLHSAGVFKWCWKTGELHDEIAIRMLMRLLPMIGGSGEPIRLLRVERLWAAMKRSDFAGATLANCIVSGNSVTGYHIYREPKRNTLPCLTLDGQAITGDTVRWDNRFDISGLDPPERSWCVRSFERMDLKRFDFSAAQANLPCPLNALEATPVLADASGAIWFPALDLHHSPQLRQRRPQLVCHFRIPPRLFPAAT